MVGTIVLLMLLAWLVCTAMWTIRSGEPSADTQSTGALKAQHITGKPTQPGE
jgi:hypothetical protein